MRSVVELIDEYRNIVMTHLRHLIMINQLVDSQFIIKKKKKTTTNVIFTFMSNFPSV